MVTYGRLGNRGAAAEAIPVFCIVVHVFDYVVVAFENIPFGKGGTRLDAGRPERRQVGLRMEEEGIRFETNPTVDIMIVHEPRDGDGYFACYNCMSAC